jgi:hypothetical protein
LASLVMTRATVGEQMGLGSEQTERGLAAVVGRMADGVSRLVSQHLLLARMELAEDARVMGGNVVRIAAFVPFVLVGYLFLSAALALFLARWLGQAGAFAVVGGVNLVGGGVGIAVAASRLKSLRPMEESTEELNRSVAVLSAAQLQARQAQAVTVAREASHGR